MGNDPINLNDPTGGFTGAIASGIFQGATQLGKSAVMTLAGAIVGMAVDLASGGEGGKGAAIGAGLGLGASFVTSTMLKSALTWLGEFALAAGPSAVQPNWSLVARTPSIGGPGGTGASAPNAPSTLSGTSPTIDLTPPPVHMPTMQAPPATNPTPAPSIPSVADVQPPSRPTPPAAKPITKPVKPQQPPKINSPIKNGNFDIDDAVDAMNKNAQPRSLGKCARYVRYGLEAGGINTEGRPVSAKDYTSFLRKKGFDVIAPNNYTPVKGDIVVMSSFTGATKSHPHGHIQMYNGSQWISDFKQKSFWPGSDYRNYKPNFNVLRW